MSNKTRNIIMVIAIFGIAVCVAFLGNTVAYFSSKTENIINKFEAGNVSIEVIEDDFDEEEAKTIEPNQTVSKNPKVKNLGVNEAYIFLKVIIPRKEVTLVDENTKLIKETKIVDLFSYKINDNWTLIKSDTTEEASTYIYAFQGTLKTDEETNPLFDEVKIVNFLEGSISKEEDLIIDIIGLALQVENVELIDNDFDKQMLNLYDNYLVK